jgi:hypothetical protein
MSGTVKTLEFLSSAKYIVNTASDCFNTCIEMTERKELIPLEKHCIEGCMSVRYGMFSQAANVKGPSGLSHQGPKLNE